jgi:hypothetical protein
MAEATWRAKHENTGIEKELPTFKKLLSIKKHKSTQHSNFKLTYSLFS